MGRVFLLNCKEHEGRYVCIEKKYADACSKANSALSEAQNQRSHTCPAAHNMDKRAREKNRYTPINRRGKGGNTRKNELGGGETQCVKTVRRSTIARGHRKGACFQRIPLACR